jgi:SAM-dependent methyltransferase
MSINMLDMTALKARQKAMWQSGDYAQFATYLLSGALDFLESCNIPAGVNVLDTGCGAGQTAIPMARNGSIVTGLDLAGNLIAESKKRAASEGLSIRLDEGDAEDLPYEDGEFDVAFSLIGAMFAPQPDLVAAEMVRVVRPGGRIIMGNWTPSGFVGQMFKTMGKHVPPAPGIPAPTLWGDEATVRVRFQPYVTDLKLTRRLYPFKYPFGTAKVVEFFREFYGPTNRAFASLDTAAQSALRHDLEQLWLQHNQATDGTVFVESEFLEVQAVRR